MAASRSPLPEFSRPVALERLAERDVSEEIVAAPQERTGLAARFGLLALDHLSARLCLCRCGEGLFRLEGSFEAEVTQACVVSLEPVRSRLEQSFSQLYARFPVEPGHEVVLDPEAEEPPEPIGPNGLDLGEAVAQQLAVALDPYPRAPGAKAPAAPEDIEPQSGSPFAGLGALKTGERRRSAPDGADLPLLRNLAKKRL